MRIEHCVLCPRRCGVSREAEEGHGFCQMGADAVAARAALHFWEEPCISGTRGSGAVFFTGCSLQCVFCQNYEISEQRKTGKRLTPQELSNVFQRLVSQGAHNINLVTGTHFVPAIVEALSLWKPPVPVVYNCGGYETLETLHMLEGLIDIYLPDLKYAHDDLALRFSGAGDYVEVAHAALLEMVRQTGPAVYDDDGIMQKGTLVRHLMLPGHTKDSMAVLDWIAAQLPDVPVSLMAQYIPCGKAKQISELNRRVTRREYEKVQNHLFDLNLDGYVQEMESASKNFIPSFQMEGLNSIDI